MVEVGLAWIGVHHEKRRLLKDWRVRRDGRRHGDAPPTSALRVLDYDLGVAAQPPNSVRKHGVAQPEGCFWKQDLLLEVNILPIVKAH